MKIKQARRIALYSHGLLKNAQFGLGLNAVQRTIDQLSYIQIDTISVVSRAHHHVLKTRVPNYSETMLHELQSSRRSVFEYWSHAAAYLPMEDYRFYHPVMLGYRKKKKTDVKMRKLILKRISQEGPLQSKDFEAPTGQKSNGWWDWKPAKLALEMMFLSGELMITKRQGFQKVYDLPENVLPDNINLTAPSNEERGHFYIRRMLRNLGVAQARDIGYARLAVSRLSGFNIQTLINQSLESLLESGEVETFQLKDKDYFCLKEVMNNTPDKVGSRRISFLSPFDNLIINRKRLQELFDYEYLLECYVPEKKRKFGYFTLPILFGDELIGRIDCKAFRKTRNFVVNNLWLEERTNITDKLVMELTKALHRYKTDLDCETISITQIDDKTLFKQLTTHL